MLLSRRVDHPAAAAGDDGVAHAPAADDALGLADLGRAKALEQRRRPVAHARDLLVQRVAIEPALRLRLYDADEAAKLLGVGDNLLFERVDGFSALLLRHCVSDPYGVSSPDEARAGIVPAMPKTSPYRG